MVVAQVIRLVDEFSMKSEYYELFKKKYLYYILKFSLHVGVSYRFLHGGHADDVSTDIRLCVVLVLSCAPLRLY